MCENTSVECTLVRVKAKVAPVSGSTIRRLEMEAAVMLAELIHSVATDLNISLSQAFTWSDSTIVLHWLNKDPGTQDVWVANRIRKISKLVHP